MIHSRPGFTPRTPEPESAAFVPAKVRSDMEPAFVRHTRAEAQRSNSPLLHTAAPEADKYRDLMQAKAEEAHKKLLAETAARKGPDVIPNPTPSATPITITPHDEAA